MTSAWTSEDIEAILLQLNNQQLPFEKYAFALNAGAFQLLGKGASACVYRGESREKHRSGYAIKVIGFGDKCVDSDVFQEAVRAQKNFSQFQGNVVKIYDAVELFVWIEGNHTVTKIRKADQAGEEGKEGNFLHLQFVLMEEVLPILKKNPLGRPILQPEGLAAFRENAIQKLAYDVGCALWEAHKNGVIHRDIKPENVFYSVKTGHYKLGDFGISRTTDTGFASTQAFTKGYGAPEVIGTLEDKYDFTADIYSFGMLLYVLLNQLRFPDSKDYHPNVNQYVKGYVAPKPLFGSDDFCDIVMKMIEFDPEERYQSMEEILNELDSFKYGGELKHRREHRGSFLVLGVFFAFLALLPLEEWVHTFGIAMAVVFVMQFLILGQRDEAIDKMYFRNNHFWEMPICVFLIIFFFGFMVEMDESMKNRFIQMMGKNVFEWIMIRKPIWVGAMGCLVCGCCLIRERFLSRKKEKWR